MQNEDNEKMYLSPFWRLPTLWGSDISDQPHTAAPMPVYHRPCKNLVLAFERAWNPTHVLIFIQYAIDQHKEIIS